MTSLADFLRGIQWTPASAARIDLEAALAGWTRHQRPDGVLFCPPPSGPPAVIRIRERVAPRPLRALAEELIADLPPAHRDSAAISAGERLITDEGEYAGLVCIDSRDDCACLTVLCGVLADDGVMQIEVAGAASQRGLLLGLAREITLGTALAQGATRRRRPWFEPPPSWTALRGRQATTYRHPRGSLTVFDATPVAGGAAERRNRMLFVDVPGQGPAAHEGTAAIQTACLDGLVLHRDDTFEAVLIDDRFVYRVRLEGPEDLVAAFLAVVHSLERIPLPGERQAFAQPVEHWVA